MSHLKICADAEIVELESRNAVLQFDRVRHLAVQSIASEQFLLTEGIILDLHEHATRGIYSDAGQLRDAPVYIQGTQHVPPPHREVLLYLREMVDYVNDNWHRTPLHLCSYLMWRCNWIHPFFDGNGRTTRAISYLVFVARLGYEPGGSPTWVDMIAADKFPYYDALDAADESLNGKTFDVSAMEALVSRLLAKQLMSIVGAD